MKKIWSDENRFSKFLEVEKANCQAYNKLGIIPDNDLKLIFENASFDVEGIRELEKITKHDVIAFTRNVSSYLGEEKNWVHYSLTSTDVVDSAQALILRECNEIIEEDINKLLEVLKRRALEFKDTPIMGRTHGMHAEVTSFGLKWCLWYDELLRLLDHFKSARKEIEVIKISGAVGNFCDVNPYVEEYVAQTLGLDYAKISTQVISRDRMTYYISSLVALSSLVEKMAFEVRNLSRTEVREVEEYFDRGQKGSSAMPHKRNPIASENMCGCARVMRGYLQAVMENNSLWHERDISHSSAERIAVSDATTLIDYMLTRYTKVLDKLTVFKQRMLKNIEATNGLVFSSRVLTKLIDKGLSREQAYDLIQPLAFDSLDNEVSFIEILKKSDVTKYLSENEINDCFDLKYYLKNTDYIYQRLNIGE